ncbi:hypothetical protein H0H92_006760 [Tricholoma furcatifolium]|nr:hypothetical protein H0H92_006760 [Tricholoma furcatifolium]
MTALGAGGALKPYLVNGANSVQFALMGVLCILSVLLVNKLGQAGCQNYPNPGNFGLGYLLRIIDMERNKQWFVLFAAVINGLSAGMYSAEGTAVLSYPEHSKRGRYLGIWAGFKNAGQLVGGYDLPTIYDSLLLT